MRYLITTGIGNSQGVLNDLGYTRQYPHLVIIDPSGSFSQIPPVSGGGQLSRLPSANTSMHQSELTFSHKTVVWYLGEAIASYRDSYNTTGDDLFFAWQSYGQPSGSAFTNPVGYKTTPEALNENIIRDGNGWKSLRLAIPDDSNRFFRTPIRLGEGVFWINPAGDGFRTGVYKGQEPLFEVDASLSGLVPQDGGYGQLGNDPNYTFGADGDAYLFAGHNFDDASPVSHNIVDMLEYKGLIYSVGQHYLIVHDPRGTRGTVIFFDQTVTESISSQDEASTFSDRSNSSSLGGSISRSLALHNGSIYMLGNTGKVYSVSHDEVKQIADLTTLGTPWSSGIFGGDLEVPGAGGYNGNPTAYRCKLFSFNQQLHALLNFRTTHRVVNPSDTSINTQGKGIAWFTSHDGTNWSDRSDMLPASGIVSPSGKGSQERISWETQTAPYKFSGFTGAVHFNPSGTYPVVYTSGIGSLVGQTGIQPAQPSGFVQDQEIPFTFNPSGDLKIADNTAFESLTFPLTFQAVSGTLFPTFVNYPSGFFYKDVNTNAITTSANPNSILIPSGQGITGYDYTGCHNYHVSAVVDDIEDIAHVIFTEDFVGAASPTDHGSTMYFTLNTSSGWQQKNHVTQSNQLNGLSFSWLFDPEIVIPSGDIYRPNPYVDHVNSRIHIDYRVYDWGFWDSFNVTGQYSTDGVNWTTFATSGGVGSSTKELDPSGIVGQSHVMQWNFAETFGKNEFFPSVQIRIKAQR